MKTEEIAKICHQANKAYCEALGDTSQKDWNEAEQWQKESAVKGVIFRLENPDVTPEVQHKAWMEDKAAEGWIYGDVKDPDKKEHPCMVPYDQLPVEQRKKDELFLSIVNALK